jgi:orotate phosphoribosyltransferase/AMMECR1 domain-containing protein
LNSVRAARKPARAELLDLLLERGILRCSESQPVLSRDGSSARWMLDSLAVTMQPRGAELAGQLMLEKLQSFDGRQLATFGLTAVPILQSIVMQSGGRHWGLLVRREQKAHGSRKLIEGSIDPDEPVIMIEDSIASGTNVSQGIVTLEAAGFRVEGCVALVRFGWEGGVSDLQARGYHVESVYDIFEDFMTRMEGEEKPNHNPTKTFPEFRWSTRRAPEGLHPAHLARVVFQEFCSSGEVLRPPVTLDRKDYDCSGGTWVSLRSRQDIYDRHAREGFWHFPGEPSWGVGEDVVRAAYLTACALPEDADRKRLIDSSHVAVSFFSPLERVTVGELDNDRYGIVVVSGERPDVMGGALPRMPGIRDEWQQFCHARFNNAALYEFEPYIVFRHEVSKFVEPGAPWQTSGVAGSEDASDCGPLAAWARNFVLGSEPEQPPVFPALPVGSRQIFVTIYSDGDVRGCMGAEISDLPKNLRELTQAALHDERFDTTPLDPDSDIAVSVSLLYNELDMGDFSPQEVRLRYRHGQQALAVERLERNGLLLPFVSTWLCLDAEDFVAEVIDKAGITREPYEWRRFDCATSLADDAGTCRLEGGFKRCLPAHTIDDIARLQCEYLERNLQEDGSLYFGYHPFQNTLYQGIDIARHAHAAWTLARLGRRDNAQLALDCVLRQPDDPPLALSRDAFSLLAMCERDMRETADCARLVSKLIASIDRHGRVATWQPSANADDAESEQDEEAFDPEELQNYVPGHVLLALAAAARRDLLTAEPQIQHAFRYYRHRFRYRRDFGQVSWMTLATAAWFQLTGQNEFAQLAFEIADFILQFQQKKSGAFITDHQPDTPGYTTAVYLEAIAAAYHVAFDFDPKRASRYDEAWHEGFSFLDRLIIQERDFSVLPNGEYALGGLRENLHSSHIRIDFVQHSLAAIVERYPYIAVTPSSDEGDKHGQEKEEGNQTNR